MSSSPSKRGMMFGSARAISLQIHVPEQETKSIAEKTTIAVTKKEPGWKGGAVRQEKNAGVT